MIRVCEWLLDAHLADGLNLLLVSDGRVRRERKEAHVEIHATNTPWMEDLADANGFGIRIEEWLRPPLYRTPVEVAILEVDPGEYGRVVRFLRGRTELWNGFPPPLQRVLWRMGLTPSIRFCDGELPEPRYMGLGFRGWAGRPNVPSWKHIREVEVAMNGRRIRVPPDELGDLVESASPHMIILEGREWRDLALSIPGVRSALEGGGVLLDSLPLGMGVRGVMEWSSLAHAPVRLIPSYSIGRVLTSVEAFRAMERRYLVPDVAVRVEGWKGVRDLLRADRGGLVLTPRPGIYWGVAQLDFDSFFPSIISRENISPETVNDPLCSHWIEVPGAGHRVCLERRGLVSEVVGGLVERKRAYRELGDEERLEAIKWILVACFGYLGYRNARFGSIESYESVTAMARHLAVRAMEVASRRGRVIHFLVDSIFVATRDPHSLAREIEEELGYRIRVDAVYNWLVFPPSLRGSGVPSRYLGGLVGGGIRARGVVRADMPPLIADLVIRSLEVLARAGDRDDLISSLLTIRDMFRETEEVLIRGEVPEELLVIERRIHPGSGAGAGRPAHWRAASLVGGVRGRVRYVEARFPYPVEMGRGGYDAGRYVAMLRRAYRPFEFMLMELGDTAGPGAPVDFSPARLL